MAIGKVKCEVCECEFVGTKRAMYCSNKCKQHARYIRSEVNKAFNKIDNGEVNFMSHEEAKSMLNKIKQGRIRGKK